MLKYGQVKSISMGGRPQPNKMAVIGGVAGSQEWGWDSLQSFAAIAARLTDNMTAPTDAPTLANFNSLLALLDDPPVNSPLKGSSINFLNNHAGSDSNIPLQFQPPQPADCRIYYTKDDFISIDNTYERIAAGTYTCIDGGNKW
jgi:hypothetical protein